MQEADANPLTHAHCAVPNPEFIFFLFWQGEATMTGYRYQISPLIKAARPRGKSRDRAPASGGCWVHLQSSLVCLCCSIALADGNYSMLPPLPAGTHSCMTKETEMAFPFRTAWDNQMQLQFGIAMVRFGNRRSGTYVVACSIRETGGGGKY